MPAPSQTAPAGVTASVTSTEARAERCELGGELGAPALVGAPARVIEPGPAGGPISLRPISTGVVPRRRGARRNLGERTSSGGRDSVVPRVVRIV